MFLTHKRIFDISCIPALAAAILLTGITVLSADDSGMAIPSKVLDTQRTRPEMWGYLVEGIEGAYTGKEPITDLCYFSATINRKDELAGAKPLPSSVIVAPGIKKHMVVAELSSRIREHLVLSPNYQYREKLIDAIAAESVNYDGVQIDFEAIPDDSCSDYLSFLKELKTRIGEKTLSVAVPAREQYAADAYNYEALSAIADRIIVMAYDEHWNKSAPGPIASAGFCEKVIAYASAHIPKEKLVMGIPLYGRLWKRPRYSREISYAEVKAIEKQIRTIEKKDLSGYPRLEWGKKRKNILYFENSETITRKISLYGKYNVQGYAFWRLGEEPFDLWNIYLSGKALANTAQSR